MTNLVLTRPLGGGGTGTLPGNIELTIINGQPTLTFLDSTRTTGSPTVAGKRLSVADHVLTFAENALTNLDWIRVANANDADSGYIAAFDGTVVFCTAHCENTGANAKDIHLYIDAVDQGSIGTLSGGTNASLINTTLNIDFVQGQKIRLRAVDNTGSPLAGGTGTIQDTIINLITKARG